MNPLLRPNAPRARTRIRAQGPEPRTGSAGEVALRLYDPIDSWGGFWGVSAREFVDVLDGLPADTSQIRLLINSPGGEVWEGLAILNALRAHPARVVAVVEGIAASAASFVAAGVDELHMARNSELFVHCAWGIALGNAEDMTKMARDLEHEDRNLAAVYARKAATEGAGDVEHWLGEMRAETWYSDDEAVTAGLADRVVDDDATEAVATARARFDLSPLARRSAQARTGGPSAGAVASHSTATSDASWNGPANERRLPDDAGPSTYRKVYAWQDPDGDENTQAAWKFPHHEVDGDGVPGAANVAGCRAGIAALNGARGGTTIPDGDRQGVYNHLARHIRDAGEDPPELESSSNSIRPTPAASARGETAERSRAVAFTDEQLATMRTNLGLAEDAGEDAIVEAMTSAMTSLEELNEQAGGSTEQTPAPANPEPVAARLPEGVVAIDSATLASLQAAARRGDEARAEQERTARETTVNAAVLDGRIPAARAEAWRAQLAADPGAADTLAGLSPGLVPVEARGHDSNPTAQADPAAGDDYWFPGVAHPAASTAKG